MEILKKNLNIKNKVLLGSGSHLEGNLQAAIITIEEGAKFAGSCDMSNSNNFKE